MTIENRTIFEGDNLPILRNMQTASVDLIYLDPPFNSNRNYEASAKSKAAGATFKDSWKLEDIKMEDTWYISNHNKHLHGVIESVEYTHSVSMKAYLIMMSVRLIETHRILKPTGSIYLHCDPTASHYLKIVMDIIFKSDNFQNEIVWAYSGPSNVKRRYPRKHDILLYFSKSSDFTHNIDSTRIPYQGKLSVGGSKSWAGKEIDTEKYLKQGKAIEDWWIDIPALQRNEKEKTGYPTQKPLSLLDRIIKASSNEDDMVLDPFCGCGTTCLSAERLSRRWVGIDISQNATELAQIRLQEELGIFGEIHHVKYSDTKED